MAERCVIVYPLSGYINRLQAVVSAGLLAEDLGARLIICWEPTELAPAEAGMILSPELVSESVRTPAEVKDEFGFGVDEIPSYLDIDASASRVSIRGLDKGEQHFMSELRDAIAAKPELSQVVLVAGGKFTLNGDAELTLNQDREFRRRRASAYAALELNSSIDEHADRQITDHRPYAALHLRYSDRNHQAPTRAQIETALVDIRTQTGLTSLFIASDTKAELDHWSRAARDLGFEPWSAESVTLDRTDPRSALGALIDWRILGGSEAMVFFSESSFAEEAAVATGSWESCIGLKASASRAKWVHVSTIGRAALTYPRRHGWWGR